MTKGPSQLERTAYHEAGHAVVAFHLRVKVVSVSIIREDGSLGRVHHKYPSAFTPDLRDDSRAKRRVETEIIWTLAGLAAEERLTGRCNWQGANSDLHEAVDVASYVTGSDRELTAYIEYLREHARNLVAVGHTWAGIKAVANELLQCQEMSAAKARQIMHTGIEAAIRERQESRQKAVAGPEAGK